LLTLAVYKVSLSFPREEMFGLTGQMGRASVSIGSNLAEGCCRASHADFARFAQIALGSASELEYQLLLARDLKMLSDADLQPLTDSVERTKRMLTALVKTLRKAAQFLFGCPLSEGVGIG